MNIEEAVLRIVRGEADAAEIRRVHEWRDASPENEERYADILHIVHSTENLRPRQVDTTPVSARTIAAMARARAARDGAGVREGSRAPAWRANVLAGLAAVAVVSAITFPGLFEMFRGDGAPMAPELVEHAEYRTDAQESLSIQLTSGVLAHLGPSSRLVVQGSESDPHLWLEGRAFFGVEGRANRQVVIETQGGKVTVLGTRFEVHSEVGDLRLLVVDGRVGMSVGEEDVEISKGEIRAVTGGVIQPSVVVEDPLQHLEWMELGMVFQNTPIDEVAREISYRYGVTIEILDPAIADRTLTTVFDGPPLEVVLDVVCSAVQVRCVIEDDSVILSTVGAEESLVPALRVNAGDRP